MHDRVIREVRNWLESFSSGVGQLGEHPPREMAPPEAAAGLGPDSLVVGCRCVGQTDRISGGLKLRAKVHLFAGRIQMQTHLSR